MQSAYFSHERLCTPAQWTQTILRQIALIISVIFHYLKSEACARCIVFKSHGSAATISALLFNFGYWPEPHCSPAFPNLGGIPPPGNMVYKKRHQAQPLVEISTPPLLPLHPIWQYLLQRSILPFSLSPFEQYPVYAFPAGTRSPLDYPTRESHRGGGRVVLHSDL